MITVDTARIGASSRSPSSFEPGVREAQVHHELAAERLGDERRVGQPEQRDGGAGLVGQVGQPAAEGGQHGLGVGARVHQAAAVEVGQRDELELAAR